MQIQINTDHNVQGYESAAATVRETVENALARFRTHITRVEVHLGHENANKRGSDDKRCMMEARLEGHQPIAVTHYAAIDWTGDRRRRGENCSTGSSARLDACIVIAATASCRLQRPTANRSTDYFCLSGTMDGVHGRGRETV